MNAPQKSQRPAGTGRQGGKQVQRENLHSTPHPTREQELLALLAETADPDPARADDRRWFAAHPQRCYRLRAVIGDEWGQVVPSAQWTLVRQTMPGVLHRAAVYFTRELPNREWFCGASPDVDAVLALIVDGLKRRPGEVVMLGEAMAQARIGGRA